MKREYICPYCFNRHKMHEVDFLCKDDTCTEIDPIYSNFWEQPHSTLNTTTPGPAPGAFAMIKPKMPTETNCKKCEAKSKTRLCRTCHSELPKSISDYDDHIIAIIGAKNSGKSHYIGVLINEIITTVGRAYKASLEAVNDETIDRYSMKFREPLYVHNRALNTTQPASADPTVKRPLLYTMKFSVGNKIKVVTLSMFDTAGEDLNSQKDMEKHMKYLTAASGIICLLDPLQIDFVREKISKTDPSILLPTEDTSTKANDILVRTTNLLRQELNVKDSKKIDIPLAVAFSKVDAIKSLVDPTSRLLQPGTHTKTNTFDLNDFDAVNEEMRSLVQEWSYGNIPNVLELNYKEFAYFGVSSLGNSPDQSMAIASITPYRVVDPFLWLLWKNGIIKGDK